MLIAIAPFFGGLAAAQSYSPPSRPIDRGNEYRSEGTNRRGDATYLPEKRENSRYDDRRTTRKSVPSPGRFGNSNRIGDTRAITRRRQPVRSRNGRTHFSNYATRDDLTERIQRLESRLRHYEKSALPIAGGNFNSNNRVTPIGYSAEAVGLPPMPAGGDMTTRLSKVEDWINKQDADAKKKKADAAKKPTFKIGGRIHADYWGFPISSSGIGFFENPSAASPAFGNAPENRFLFRRIRLETRGDVFETMMYRIQIDFNNPQTPELKDVWLGFKNLPCNHEVLIGIQKRPLGMDHLNSSRYNIFTERPLVVEAFNEDARRPGITLYGNSDDDSLGWTSGLYLLENVTSDGRYLGNSTQASWNTRLHGSPIYESDGRDWVHLAIAGMIARPDGDDNASNTNANEGRFRTRSESRANQRWINTGRIPGADWYEVLAFESMFNSGPFQIGGEYQFNWLQRDGTTPGTGPDVFFHGAYVHVGYFLTGEHITYNRKRGVIGRVTPDCPFWLADWCKGCRGSGWGAWQIALRYSYLDLTSQDVLGGVEQNVQLAMNWHWTSHSKVQFGVIYGNIEQHAPVGGFDGGSFLIVGTRFMADF